MPPPAVVAVAGALAIGSLAFLSRGLRRKHADAPDPADSLVLVAGSGRLAVAIGRRLLDSQCKTRFLVRSNAGIERLKAELGSNIDVVVASYADSASLRRACLGVTCVISTLVDASNPRGSLVATQSALLRAARAEHVTQFIPSHFSAAPARLPPWAHKQVPLLASKASFLDVLSRARGDIAYTCIATGLIIDAAVGGPGSRYEGLELGQPTPLSQGPPSRCPGFWDIAKGSGGVIYGTPDARVAVVTIADLAAFTVACVGAKQAFNQVVEVASAVATWGEISRGVELAMGRRLEPPTAYSAQDPSEAFCNLCSDTSPSTLSPRASPQPRATATNKNNNNSNPDSRPSSPSMARAGQLERHRSFAGAALALGPGYDLDLEALAARWPFLASVPHTSLPAALQALAGTQVHRFALGEYTCTLLIDLHAQYNTKDIFPELMGEGDHRLGKEVLGCDGGKHMGLDGGAALVIPYSLLHVKTREHSVLIDTGCGPGFAQMIHSHSSLHSKLLACGVVPADVNAIFLTHAHPDHIGGLLDEAGEKAYFPNAKVYLGAAEWELWTADKPDLCCFCQGNAYEGGREHIAEYIKGILTKLGRERCVLLTSDSTTRFEPILPGITAKVEPGHTDGSLLVEISSQGRSLVCVGDAFLHPSIIAHPEWRNTFDHHAGLAEKARRHILRHLAQRQLAGKGAGGGDDVMLYGTHLPFPCLGTVGQDEYGMPVLKPIKVAQYNE